MNIAIIWIVLSWAISQALVMQFNGDFSEQQRPQIDVGFGYRPQPDNHKPFIHHLSKVVFVVCLAVITAFVPILLTEVLSRVTP